MTTPPQPAGVAGARTLGRLLLAGWFALLVEGCGSRSPADPIVDGRPLSVWMTDYRPELNVPEGAERDLNGWSLDWEGRSRQAWETSARARRAIRSAGTNAVPLLLDYIRRRDNIVSGNLKAIRHATMDSEYNRQGEAGLIALGELAVSAIPQLQKLARTPQGIGYDTRGESATRALNAIQNAMQKPAEPAGGTRR